MLARDADRSSRKLFDFLGRTYFFGLLETLAGCLLALETLRQLARL